MPLGKRKMAALPAVEHSDIDKNLFAELSRYCREGHLEFLQNALYYERDVLNYFLIRTQKGNTLIHEAVESDQGDVVQLLLLHGVSPNIRARGGLTPLHVAATKGHVGCVLALLEAGADTTLRDDIGHDAVTKAERSKKRDAVLRLLNSKGVCCCSIASYWTYMSILGAGLAIHFVKWHVCTHM